MLRVLVIFLIIALVAVGAVWLVEHPGDVTILWLGVETKVSIGVAIVGLLLLAAAIAALWSALRFILRIPRLLSVGSRARRQEKGFAALSKGLIAVGSGDMVGAQRHAQDARKLVGGHPLSLLLDAQAAQLSGDRDGAKRAFEAMTKTQSARLLGWRGAFVEAQRAGDADAARHAADQAVAFAPSAAWANEAVLADRFARSDWAGARQALERAERLRVLDKPTSRRHRAVLFAGEAEDAVAHDPAKALQLAREACHLAPDLVPSVALAARLMGERGDVKKATRLIESAWRTGPHPDLAQVYVHLRPGDSALDRLHRAQTLAKLAPGDAESRAAVAAAAIDARELALARAELDALLADQPTVRACLLMADLVELEDSTGGSTRYWLNRAARAPRDKAWIADGVVSDKWRPTSPITGRLDAFSWATPPELISHGVDAEPLPEEPSAFVAPVAPAPASISQPIGPPPVDASPAAAPVPPTVVGPVETPIAAPTKPTPVIFPIAHAPDDPGAEAGEPPRRWRAFNG